MKKVLIIWLGLVCGCGIAQDLKETSSDKTAIMEGRLRNTKPTMEIKLSDGTQISIWTMPVKKADGSTDQHLAKAVSENKIPQQKEGNKTIKVDFNFDEGKLCGVQYSEMLVLQNPTPSVSTKKKEFVYTDGMLTSPAPGSFPEMESYVNACLSEIQKAFQHHVSTR